MRRVVTGEDEQGRSVVVQDGEPPHSVFLESTGFGEHAVWHVELPPPIRSEARRGSAGRATATLLARVRQTLLEQVFMSIGDGGRVQRPLA